jgi:hypothetical protein
MTGQRELRASASTSLTPTTLAAACTLVALMALGSVLMWIGVPLGLMWLASHLQQGTDPSMGPYVVVILGLPIAMVVIGRALAALDRLFSRVTGYDPNDRPVPVPWLKSMRAERGSSHKRTVLDLVMIVSVVLAGIAFLAWFFLFAHPGAPHS